MVAPSWQALCDGDNLAPSSATVRTLQRVRDVLGNTEKQAPFQFVLPLLASLYWDINELPVPPEDKWKNVLHPPKGDEKEACTQPLRAIVYFSWERERRVFLVRRAFPYFFDFLSYSHCPPGWGSLGRLLQEFEAEPASFNVINAHTRAYRGYVDSARYPVSPVALLPYLSEIRRIGHKAALVLPVVDTTETLRGCFLFCTAAEADLPSDGLSAQLRLALSAFIRQFESLLTVHDQNVEQFVCAEVDGKNRPLAELWRETRQQQGKRVALATLSVSCAKDVTAGALADLLIASLQDPAWYPLIERAHRIGQQSVTDMLIAFRLDAGKLTDNVRRLWAAAQEAAGRVPEASLKLSLECDDAHPWTSEDVLDTLSEQLNEEIVPGCHVTVRQVQNTLRRETWDSADGKVRDSTLSSLMGMQLLQESACDYEVRILGGQIDQEKVRQATLWANKQLAERPKWMSALEQARKRLQETRRSAYWILLEKLPT